MKRTAFLSLFFISLILYLPLQSSGSDPDSTPKTDSLSDSPASSFIHSWRIKHKKQRYPSPLIAKMSDEQLTRLIDYLFESAYIPPDLWNEVMMEAAKRNISKANRQMTDLQTRRLAGLEDITSKLLVKKPIPAPVAPKQEELYPASRYYADREDDISSLFTNQFPDDTAYTLELESTQYGCFNMPAQGPLSSPFGWRYKRYHKGIDIQLRKGDTVTCAFNGMVRFAQKKGGYGNLVIVRHFNGLETVYAHLYKIKVKEGQVIRADDLIGLAGSTGHSTGPHLHFEVRFLGLPVNPQYFISYNYGKLLFNTVIFKKNQNGLLAAFYPGTEFHTVEKGETLAEISNHYGITISQLRELNNLTQKHITRLRQGQTLRVKIEDHSAWSGKGK